MLFRSQELIDLMRTSLAAQRSDTQRLLASSGLPLMTEDDEATYGNLKQVIPVSPSLAFVRYLQILQEI